MNNLKNKIISVITIMSTLLLNAITLSKTKQKQLTTMSSLPENILLKNSYKKVSHLLNGGETRKDSSFIGINSIEEAEAKFVNYRYGDFKKEVADAVIEVIEPLQQRYKEIIENKLYLKVLQEGAIKARKVANKTLKSVHKAVGLLDINE